MTYVFVNALMIILDRRDGSAGNFLGLDWAYWLIIGWGLGVAGHAISVFFDEHRVQRLYQREKSWERTG
jgi:hypothetical protein